MPRVVQIRGESGFVPRLCKLARNRARSSGKTPLPSATALISKLDPRLQPGDLVRHSSNPKNRYQLMFILDHSAWAIRQSEGDEVMMVIENLTLCQ